MRTLPEVVALADAYARTCQKAIEESPPGRAAMTSDASTLLDLADTLLVLVDVMDEHFDASRILADVTQRLQGMQMKRLGRNLVNHLYGRHAHTACGAPARHRTTQSRTTFVNCEACLVQYRNGLLGAGIVRWLLDLVRSA